MSTEIKSTYVDSVGAFKKSMAFSVVLIALSLNFFAGCFHLISEYDIHTYRNLTELKGEMKVAFEKFGENGASGEDDLETLQTFWVKISQALEYEKGKNLNNDTIEQFTILDQTIREVLERFELGESGLSAGYAKAKWMILENAFDIAIQTESEKLKKRTGGQS